MSLLAGWRPAVRIAARDALRSKGRSLLVLAMIALPVLAVTAADVVVATAEVSGAEALDRRLGSADALVTFVGGDVAQRPDPDVGATWGGPESEAEGWAPGLGEVSAALGHPVEGTEWREANVGLVTDAGVAELPVDEVDLRAPVADGLYRLTDGALPTSTGEVAVTAALARRGPGLGEQLEVVDGPTLRVVGVVEHARYRDQATAVTLPGGFGADPGGERYDGGVAWLVDGEGEVDWRDVLALNDAGALVVSRAVLTDPPAESEIAPEMQHGGVGVDDGTLAVVVLIVVMALIEVVLLAGPAFAVGARRQQRTLALVAAAGGTPRQMRRVILAGGLVLGGVAAVLGVVLGLAVAWAVLPLVQRFSGEWLGPFDVPWMHVAGIAAFGLVSALLAAVVPARIAARQDVVAVLAGRRGDRRPTLRTPVLGAVLFALGVLGAVWSARSPTDGELYVAVSAILVVLGMVLLVPAVLALVARLARVLPLALRYAVRDATRHRTRTVPAVAAVAATVAGVTALGIGAASDEAQSRESYHALTAMGSGVLGYAPYDDPHDPATWRALTEVVEERLPGRTVSEVVGVPTEVPGGGFRDVVFRGTEEPVLTEYASAFGTSVLVTDESPVVDVGLPEAARDEADEVLASGGAVVFVSGAAPSEETVLVQVEEHLPDRNRPRRSPAVEVPVLFVTLPHTAYAAALLPPSLVPRLGLEAVPTALAVEGPIDEAVERDVEESVAGVTDDAYFMVERGYERDDEYVIVLLVLGALGAVLVVGGTLTATFLALSDARPDLATLAAVGAAPRTRRAVAAAYALVVGLVGAVLGTLVGLVPGIAVTYPLTGDTTVGPGGQSHYLDIPWLLLVGVVVLVPLLTAAVVALAARSRLPMVARLA